MSALTPLDLFFFNAPATTEIYTLSLHDALPISSSAPAPAAFNCCCIRCFASAAPPTTSDRKSTRLNSSHRCISYAVFFLKNIQAPLLGLGSCQRPLPIQGGQGALHHRRQQVENAFFIHRVAPGFILLPLHGPLLV